MSLLLTGTITVAAVFLFASGRLRFRAIDRADRPRDAPASAGRSFGP